MWNVRTAGRRQLAACQAVVVLLSLMLTGCAKTALHLVNDYDKRKPTVVGVVPIEGGEFDETYKASIEKTIVQALRQRGYVTVDGGHIRAAMEAGGISEKELGVAEIRQLGEAVGVDALVRTRVEEFRRSSMVFATHVKCVMRFALVENESGEVLWREELDLNKVFGGFLVAPFVSCEDAIPETFQSLPKGTDGR